MNEPLRLVAVLTRGYDEPGEGAATLARYAAAGHEVMVVACTGGDGEGAVLEVLGVGRHWLGFRDSGAGASVYPKPQLAGAESGTRGGRERDSRGFAEVPVEEPTERLVRVLREFRPHVVVVYGDVADGGPDRARCREVSVAAFDAAGDPRRFPAAGEAWQPRKLYHVHEWHEERMRALHEALLAEGLVSPYHEWLKEPTDAGPITTRVPCGDYFSLRDQVLRMHADQLDPASHWFAVPARVRQAVWPTEDFELARCHVPTSLPEDDLFAGITAHDRQNQYTVDRSGRSSLAVPAGRGMAGRPASHPW